MQKCVLCEAPAADGLKCVEHRDAHRDAQRSMKDRRRLAGFCIGCGRVAVSRFVRCLDCRMARRAASRTTTLRSHYGQFTG